MNQAKILIVDDSRANAQLVHDILVDHYTLKCVHSGEEALLEAPAFLPDLILLDVIMPGIDGYETCRQLRKQQAVKYSKIIIVSSQKNIAERLEGYQAGADDYLPKPFDNEELLAKTRVYLRLKSTEEVNEKINQSFLQTISSLALAMEAKDAYTSGHSTRVAQMAASLGRKLGLDQTQIQRLEWAGYLHDIGKIGIRDDILNKPGKLTEEEFEHIKTHPVLSYRVLQPVQALKCVLPAVKHHHEHYDGSGYPDGLTAEEIPLHARILKVADVWDALTTTRSYRQAMSKEQAIQILKQEVGKTMDPFITLKLLEIIKSESEISQASSALPLE